VLNRWLLVGGLILIAAGAYGGRTWDTRQPIAEVGVIALIALGFFATVVGTIGVLREETPADPVAARRAAILSRVGWKSLVPALLAGACMTGFFALTGRWAELENPVQSQLALIFAVIGLLVGILIDRISRWELVIIPAVLLVALLGWGNRLPLDSETTSRGEMVTLLVIVILFVMIAINLPQVTRGRRPATRRD